MKLKTCSIQWLPCSWVQNVKKTSSSSQLPREYQLLLAIDYNRRYKLSPGSSLSEQLPKESANCSRQDPHSFNQNKQCRQCQHSLHTIVYTDLLTILSTLHWPLDNTQHSNEVIIFKVRHVDPQQVRPHLLLNILKRKYSGLKKITSEKSLVHYIYLPHPPDP